MASDFAKIRADALVQKKRVGLHVPEGADLVPRSLLRKALERIV